MGLRHNPITYLFLSNALLWGLPLAINHWQAARPLGEADAVQVASQQPAAPAAALLTDPLLGIGNASISKAGPDKLELGAGKPGADKPATAGAAASPVLAAASMPFRFEVTAPAIPSTGLLGQLRGADGLGGAITLGSLREPVVPIAARAEQLQWQRSNDALAPLPLHWREPLRKELGDRVKVSRATTVRLPVRDLAERQELPVIITDKGVAEGLVKPKNPRTQAAVESWAARQRPAEAGTVQVMVVAAEPVQAPAAESAAETGAQASVQASAVVAAPAVREQSPEPALAQPQAEQADPQP